MNETSTEIAAPAAKTKPNYCRRQITMILRSANSQTEQIVFCMKTITTANALDWCNDCRAERLPLWPANDPQPTQTQEVH